MNDAFLLDTNIIIALFAQELSVLSKIASENVFIPSIVIGELYFGAEKSTRKKDNKTRIDQLRRNSTILSCTEETATFYGQIKAHLKENGTPIPDNDVWIAAIAQENNLTLVSRDQHFQHIENFPLVKW
ncbi:MAG: type II toxin-antitoxin system VapC family toxin [Bacteroidetes bacterium]|nr:type II toxin-antitoxin system VapC family toxin [Bacteroidota bacterium]